MDIQKVKTLKPAMDSRVSFLEPNLSAIKPATSCIGAYSQIAALIASPAWAWVIPISLLINGNKTAVLVLSRYWIKYAKVKIANITHL